MCPHGVNKVAEFACVFSTVGVARHRFSGGVDTEGEPVDEGAILGVSKKKCA